MENTLLYKKYIVENLSCKECAKYFGVSETTIKRLIKKYGFYKSDEQKSQILSKKSQKIIIEKEVLYDLYITHNLTIEECAKELKVSYCVVKRRLNEFGIKKPKNKFKEIHKTHSRQTDKSLKKRKETIFKKYGVDNVSKIEKIKKKKIITTQNHYGVGNPFQAQFIKKKISKKNMKKYGVPYSCMREECRKYSGNNSKPNQNFANFLEKLNIKYEREFSIKNYSYDFKVNNYLFEIDPTIFHNSTFAPKGNPKDKDYHMNKSIIARNNNFRCIHIFDWDNEEKIIKTFLVEKERVYARKCEIKGVSVNEAKQFLNENHLQGYANDLIRLGLYYNNELVEIMTFAKPRYNKKYDYEIIRLCAIKNVVGGAQRLLSEFIKMYNPKNIISYCDLSKFDGNVYRQLGFKSINKPQPSKHWYNLKTGQHITDNLLRQKGFDQLFKTNYGKGTSNEDLMRESGFVEIFDCGQLTFLLAL